MIGAAPTSRSRRSRSRGVTIAEAAIASVIVAGMLVAALNSVAASRTLRARVADRARGQQLALDLMSEILQQGFADPAATPPASRAAWQYVDDYNGLVDAPLATRSGTPIPDCAGWARSVSVQWADPTTFKPTTLTGTGVRLITVTVTRGTLVLASVSAYRTSAWTNALTAFPPLTTNHAPLAAATGSPLAGAGGSLTVSFSGAASSDPDGNALSYAWDFGDGTAGAGATPSHTYAAAGAYTATLTVSDGLGGVAVGAVNVTVSP